MKKNLLFYTIMTVAIATTSCTNGLLTDLPSAEDPIKIVASISSQTRAPQLTNDGKGSFSKGDKMTLFLSEKDGNKQSVDFEYGTGILTWGSLGLSGSGEQITLAACYPQQKTIQDGTFEFSPLTASEKDLLLAPAQNVTAGTTNTVFLTFNHAMHRLDLTFTPGNSYTSEDLKDLTIALNAKTTCVVDGVQGKIKEVKDSKGEYTANDTQTTFYLVPQNTSDITLSISIGNNNKSLTLDKLLEQLDSHQNTLEGGKRSSLTLKVSREGITIEGGSINAWGNQVTADGEVVIG
ncbi:MAG: fimbrillin family protein [Parabacteroides sp.]|nr:fimbrillin family protein [Parabacteroides sp.]